MKTDCSKCAYQDVCDYEKTGNCEIKNEEPVKTFKVRLAPTGKINLQKVFVDDSRGSDYGDN